MIHQLKIKGTYFDAVASGGKTFESRYNDRGFKVGDFLGLNKISSKGTETGESLLVEITYILGGHESLCENFVVLGIKPCRIETYKQGYNASIKKGMEIYGGMEF